MKKQLQSKIKVSFRFHSATSHVSQTSSPLYRVTCDDGCNICLHFPPDALNLGSDGTVMVPVTDMTQFCSTDCSQQEMYNRVARDYVNELLSSSVPTFASIIAYGPTGSGKTHTLFGSTDDSKFSSKDVQPQDGVMKRTIHQIFNSQVEPSKVSITMIEIDGRNVYNLLSSASNSPSTSPTDDIDPPSSSQRSKIDVIYDSQLDQWQCKKRYRDQEGSVQFASCEQIVTSYTEALQCLRDGRKKRRVNCTLRNSKSSRTHQITTISVTRDGSLHPSHITFVDLAGIYEKYNDSLLDDEICNINLSLSYFKRCILELSKGKNGESNNFLFRNTPLTMLLKESLSPRSSTHDPRAHLIICSDTLLRHRKENLEAIKFGCTASNIQLREYVPKSLPRNDLKILESEYAQKTQDLMDMHSREKAHYEKKIDRLQQAYETLWEKMNTCLLERDDIKTFNNECQQRISQLENHTIEQKQTIKSLKRIISECSTLNRKLIEENSQLKQEAEQSSPIKELSISQIPSVSPQYCDSSIQTEDYQVESPKISVYEDPPLDNVWEIKRENEQLKMKLRSLEVNLAHSEAKQLELHIQKLDLEKRQAKLSIERAEKPTTRQQRAESPLSRSYSSFIVSPEDSKKSINRKEVSGEEKHRSRGALAQLANINSVALEASIQPKSAFVTW